MTPLMMSEPLSRKLSAGKPFTARAFYRSGLPPRVGRMHTRRMSASVGAAHSPAATVRSARSCAYPRVGPLLHSDSTIPEGSELPAAAEGASPAGGPGPHYFRAPPSSLLSDSSITSTDTDGMSSTFTASLQPSASLIADSSRLRNSEGSVGSSGAAEPLTAVGTDSGDIDSARGRDRRRPGTPSGGGGAGGVGAAAGGVWPWFAVIAGAAPGGADGSEAGSEGDDHAQVCFARCGCCGCGCDRVTLDSCLCFPVMYSTAVPVVCMRACGPPCKEGTWGWPAAHRARDTESFCASAVRLCCSSGGTTLMLCSCVQLCMRHQVTVAAQRKDLLHADHSLSSCSTHTQASYHP